MKHISDRLKVGLIIAIVSIIIVGCTPPAREGKKVAMINEDQKRFQALISERGDCYFNSINDIQKEECYSNYKKKIGTYINDTLKGVFRNFKVKITQIRYFPWQGETALLFYAEMEQVKFWSETHFNNEDSMKQSSIYKQIAMLPQNRDTVLSFVYLPEFEIESRTIGGNLKIEVIPIPDSLAHLMQNVKKKIAK